jgi:hypothetical protein
MRLSSLLTSFSVDGQWQQGIPFCISFRGFLLFWYGSRKYTKRWHCKLSYSVRLSKEREGFLMALVRNNERLYISWLCNVKSRFLVSKMLEYLFFRIRMDRSLCHTSSEGRNDGLERVWQSFLIFCSHLKPLLLASIKLCCPSETLYFSKSSHHFLSFISRHYQHGIFPIWTLDDCICDYHCTLIHSGYTTIILRFVSWAIFA